MKKKFPAKKELCSKVYLDECFAFHADKFMSFLHIFLAFSSSVHTLKLSFRHLPVYLSVCLSICLCMYLTFPLSLTSLSICLCMYFTLPHSLLYLSVCVCILLYLSLFSIYLSVYLSIVTSAYQSVKTLYHFSRINKFEMTFRSEKI